MKLTMQRRVAWVTTLALAATMGAGCGEEERRAGATPRTIPLVEAPPATTSTTPAPTQTPPAAEPAPTRTTRPRPTPSAPASRSQRARLDAALEPLDAEVAPATTQDELALIARTPGDAADALAGGTLGQRAGEIFRAVYHVARYRTPTVIAFQGGLGAGESRDTVAAIFQLTRRQAARIDWASEDSVALMDWTPFLLTIHPSLR